MLISLPGPSKQTDSKPAAESSQSEEKKQEVDQVHVDLLSAINLKYFPNDKIALESADELLSLLYELIHKQPVENGHKIIQKMRDHTMEGTDEILAVAFII